MLLLFMLLTIASKVHMETKGGDVKCEDPTKYCENIWYCKENSFPEKYKACGHDGLVDRVCCDPKYTRTKSRKYCDAMSNRHIIDEYGNVDYGYTKPLPKNIQSIAALGHRSESSTKWVCAGNLISNKFVLTAAKCLNQSINIIRIGANDLQKNDDGIETQEHGVLRQIIHPKYKYPFVYNDIALIELNDTVTFTDFVKPICIYDDAMLREALWLEIGYKANDLTYIQVIGLKRRACEIYFEQDKFANLVPFGVGLDTQICGSSHLFHDSCQPTIGGPLQCLDLNYEFTNFLIGITVIPKPCSKTNEPGLYTRVSHYAPWIESIIFPDN